MGRRPGKDSPYILARRVSGASSFSLATFASAVAGADWRSSAYAYAHIHEDHLIGVQQDVYGTEGAKATVSNAGVINVQGTALANATATIEVFFTPGDSGGAHEGSARTAVADGYAWGVQQDVNVGLDDGGLETSGPVVVHAVLQARMPAQDVIEPGHIEHLALLRIFRADDRGDSLLLLGSDDPVVFAAQHQNRRVHSSPRRFQINLVELAPFR